MLVKMCNCPRKKKIVGMDYKKVVWGWVIFYAIATIIIFFKGVKLFDFVAYIVILILILVIQKKGAKIPVASIWLFGFSTLFHVIGMIPFMQNGEQVSLYHNTFFFGQYDMITHFIGFFFLTVGFLFFYYFNNKKITRISVLILFLALVGVGTLIEISEYLGYRLFGFGWGAFQFGEGDNSMNFGPWGDSMTDTISNILGIFFGFICYLISIMIWKNLKIYNLTSKDSLIDL